MNWHDSMESALVSFAGDGVVAAGERGIGGGCISSTGILSLSNGRKVFIKRNSSSAEDMFRREAEGLEALGSVDGGPPVPAVLAGGTEGPFAFLIMEYLESGSSRSDFWEDFGRSLAIMHRNGRAPECGFSNDNYIGASPQPNKAIKDWIDFFRIRRLEFQLKMARDRGAADSTMSRLVTALMDKLDNYLIPCDSGGASLLHGDLWSGNHIYGPDGRAWIIDPAVYYGHREADLAMTELFGGCSRAFYQAYKEEWPLEPGYSDRRDLYNLYHMLNHLNLFGGSYAGSVLSIARRYAG